MIDIIYEKNSTRKFINVYKTFSCNTLRRIVLMWDGFKMVGLNIKIRTVNNMLLLYTKMKTGFEFFLILLKFKGAQ